MNTPDIDPRLDRRWRELSSELPSPAIDASIRAAARRARPRPAWQRLVPLAAAASVGVIAFLIVRQTPPPAPGAPPATRSVAPPVEAPVAASAEAPAEASTGVPGEAGAEAPIASREEPPAPSRTEAPATEAPSAAAPVAAAATPAHAPSNMEAPPVAAAPKTPALPRSTPPSVRARVEDAMTDARKSADVFVRALPSPAAETPLRNGESSREIEMLPPPLEDLIKADAARRRGVDPASVIIVSAEPVTWSDGALGCRAPGEIAIQVLMPGFRVIVDAGGTELVYHTDRDRRFRLCPRIGSVR